MKGIEALKDNVSYWFLLFITLIFFLLRFPSLYEPYWYGDEGIYQSIGIALNKGKILYKEIFDNKLPLLYIIYSILKSDQFLVRLLSLIFGIFTVTSFFYLARRVYEDHKLAKIACFIATSVFALFFSLPLIEGNIANAENFMLLPITLSSLLVYSAVQSNGKFLKFLISGFLLGIAFLFKAVAIFDFIAFLTFYLFVNTKSNQIVLSKLKLFTVSLLIPIVITSIYFLYKGAFSDFIFAVFTSNISYVNYENTILGNIPLLIFLKFIILISIIYYLYVRKKHLTKSLLFILIWLTFSIFNALFSQRPYTHYMIVLLPSLSLMLGELFVDRKYQKKIIVITLLVLIILLTNFNFFGLKKTFLYYLNFVGYISGNINSMSYYSFFDKNTTIDYEISFFIKPKLNKDDSIFIWGNNAQLYKLSNVAPATKYIVEYHISNYKDGLYTTKVALEKTKPKFIIIMPDQKPYPFSLSEYFNKININGASVYERIF